MTRADSDIKEICINPVEHTTNEQWKIYQIIPR